MRRFLRLAKTVRIAQTLEDRRQSRTLAQIHYAIWFKDAKKHQRKNFNKYLREMGGLDKFFEDEFLGKLTSGEDAPETKEEERPKDRPPPTLEEIEEFIESGSNEWGNVTMDDLWRYKEHKERRERAAANNSVYVGDERNGDNS